MIAIVCPGQGSQKPGFLVEWLALEGVRAHLERLSEAAGLDLVHYGTEADEETIKDTAVAQPLIVAAGLVAGRLLADRIGPGREDLVFAGHSVGEITASALAGALTEADAMAFVRTRANAMAEAAAAAPTGMSAVLGGKEDEVLAAIEAAELTPANANGGGQVVAAGTLEQLAALAENPPARARVIPLKVAGAFHTEHMAPALEPLRELTPRLSPADPVHPLLSNTDGAPVASGAANLESLVAQVCRPVRWDLCMQTLLERGVEQLIELPPAGTLAGLAKRGMKGVPALAVNSAAELEQARSILG
ncbi:ACP S-malonyltransferase [Kocuria dechangensis]|uniref:[acyl-carrier-protein] S-malonyltransferase n=1 Tax=Kocuria dechangensis TaxID=1176249 RepID=A0A917LY69_9MICC|nr:ACP S-malonyltransferase [Kocuria dechangensis]GGG64866.1 ACP S-malonyltransferase [Kocuria dechangensis]